MIFRARSHDSIFWVKTQNFEGDTRKGSRTERYRKTIRLALWCKHKRKRFLRVGACTKLWKELSTPNSLLPPTGTTYLLHRFAACVCPEVAFDSMRKIVGISTMKSFVVDLETLSRKRPFSVDPFCPFVL